MVCGAMRRARCSIAPLGLRARIARRAIASMHAISNSSMRRSGCFFPSTGPWDRRKWSDLGMFVQTVMLLARGEGLHTCGIEAWTHWHRTVSAHLDLPNEQMLFCGMALGHA